MSDPVASALLIVAAIAYLGGAVVVVAALAKVLATWPQGWRTRRAAEPADQALQQRAAAAMAGWPCPGSAQDTRPPWRSPRSHSPGSAAQRWRAWLRTSY